MTRRIGPGVCMLLIGLSAASCQRPAGARPSRELQDEVRAAASAYAVRIEVERDRFLIVGLVESALDDLPAADKRAAARDIAARVYRNYRSQPALRVVSVAFVEQTRRLLVFPARDIRDAFHFAVTELDPLAPALTEGWERPPAPPHDLYFVAVGDVPAALMSSLAADAEKMLGTRVAVLQPLPVDETMVDSKRSQLIADELIAGVRARYPDVTRDPRARVVAVTARDMISKARKETWRFSLSLRSKDNSVAVVSYARMDSAFLGHTPDEALLRSRLRKMVNKNIGILYYGLPVSSNPQSVLYGDVGGLPDLDYMSEFFEPRR